jgi:hypothetical protein
MGRPVLCREYHAGLAICDANTIFKLISNNQ